MKKGVKEKTELNYNKVKKKKMKLRKTTYVFKFSKQSIERVFKLNFWGWTWIFLL